MLVFVSISSRSSLISCFGLLVSFVLIGLDVCSGLNAEQRSELARKFKYYHPSVRPGNRFNLLETINGTFFALNVEVEVLATTPANEMLEVELALGVHFHDERLVLRDLEDMIMLPEEFEPWRPILEFPEHTIFRVATHIDPQNGQMSLRYKLRVNLACRSLAWTKPFQQHFCQFKVLTNNDERLFLKVVRDLRTESEMQQVDCHIDQWPFFILQCKYRNQWLSAIVKVYMPSVLVFTVCVFAQWKRRKMQVFVTLGALIGLILLQTANDLGSCFTMQDMWMIGTLLHLVTLLTIDLILPARRLIRTTYTNLNENASSAFFNRVSSDQKPFLTTASYKDTLQRLLRPISSSRPFSRSSGEPATFVESQRLPPAHHDLLDIAMADDEDEDDADLNQMRTTVIHVQRPANRSTQTQSTNSPSMTKPSTSLSASATTVTSPGSAAIIRRSQIAPTNSAIRSQYHVTRWSIGRKKRVALIAILGCYTLFAIAYSLLALSILS
ncbi:hypothetical protein M3Y96_00498500 [Aphelenchoides besseyi]|nr:hypothetical protein M3Y96_00498500 [Aphelenchoides besseyi]